MSFVVKTTPSFERDAKRLYKKYISLASELQEIVVSLEENPLQGTAIGKGCYKIRFSIASKGKGKSGGGRLITYVHVMDEIVTLLAIYDKSEVSNLSDAELEFLLGQIDE